MGGIGYSGAGGAAGHATSATVAGGTYTFSASYDAAVRLSSLSVTNASTSAVLFSSQRGYDAASNVTAVNTTLAAGTGGTDNQAFCYDEQNRLTWAGSSGTPACDGTLTPGTLTSASYTQTFAYDTLDRLTSGPLGSYTYGDSAHLHAVTSIGSGGTNSYTATYDASGDMTCRAPDNTTTCAGTPTGAQLGYDSEGRLATWQNTPTSPPAATASSPMGQATVSSTCRGVYCSHTRRLNVTNDERSSGAIALSSECFGRGAKSDSVSAF